MEASRNPLLRTVIGDLLPPTFIHFTSYGHCGPSWRSYHGPISITWTQTLLVSDFIGSANWTKKRVSRANINLHNHRRLYTTFFISPLGRRLTRMVACRSFSIDLQLLIFGTLRYSSNWLVFGNSNLWKGHPTLSGRLVGVWVALGVGLLHS